MPAAHSKNVTSDCWPTSTLQCCQPCDFPVNVGLFFGGVAGFFEDFRVACLNWNLLAFWACFLQISVLQITFFQFVWHFCCFNLLLKAYWVCFCENLLIFGLLFQFFHPAFLFNFLADFLFGWIFLRAHVGLVFSVKWPVFGLFFKFTYLFNCKITWHHWHPHTSS